MNTSFVSICIPYYEQNGKGREYITKLLDSIVIQNYKNFEVIIADNGQAPELSDIIPRYTDKLLINCHYNPKRGVAHNTNFCLDQAKGDVIKIMFQDDLFACPDALEQFVKQLESGSQWCIADSAWIDAEGNHKKDFQAKFSEAILTGTNTVGMPSVIAFKRNELRFDTHLRTRLDTEFYFQLFHKYGHPGYINSRPLVSQRIHKDSMSSTQDNYNRDDLRRIQRKYPDLSHPLAHHHIPKNFKTLENTPSAISRHLPLLKEIAMQCEHVTELNTGDVVATYALIEGTPKKLVCYDGKYSAQILPAKKLAKEMGVEFVYKNVPIENAEIEETDFLFINSTQSYERDRNQVLINSHLVRKFIGITNFTAFALHALTAIKPEWTVYRNDNGIMILKRTTT